MNEELHTVNPELQTRLDELAHTNVPGSRNVKRYQDVEEILAAGIHVITTLNIQHLESLYDTVEQVTGVKVRERIPDRVVAEADQIVNVDKVSFNGNSFQIKHDRNGLRPHIFISNFLIHKITPARTTEDIHSE